MSTLYLHTTVRGHNISKYSISSPRSLNIPDKIHSSIAAGRIEPLPEVAGVVAKLAENRGELGARVVDGGVAAGPGYHHFARLENECRSFWFSLVYQTNHLRMAYGRTRVPLCRRISLFGNQESEMLLNRRFTPLPCATERPLELPRR